MNWVEVIKVQGFPEPQEETTTLKTLVKELQNTEAIFNIRIYVNAEVKNDLAVLIERKGKLPGQLKTREGNVISDYLCKKGLTNYSIWTLEEE